MMTEPPSAGEPRLALPEALRTIGLSLEPLRVSTAQIAVTATGITVTGSGA